MSNREELIKSIGDKIVDELFKKVNDEYSIEYDEYGFDCASINAQFGYEYGNGYCDVSCYVSWKSKSSADVECSLDGCEGKKEKCYKKLDRLNDAVQVYVDEHLDTDELLEVIEDDHREACADEWECHGFRNEADYINWRYK